MTAATGASSLIESSKQHLRAIAERHACSIHSFFSYVKSNELSVAQIAAMLRNYDAHAGVLRRLLLNAATLMPEEAVTYILENVRNEYGNGDPAGRHELQLRDLATRSGIDERLWNAVAIQPGVRAYIGAVLEFYKPEQTKEHYRPAIIAGAITATELLALEEFRAIQHAFRSRGLQNHIWFDHVNVEAEHADESLALALHFIERHDAVASVEYGMVGVLNANVSLYDGLLMAASI